VTGWGALGGPRSLGCWCDVPCPFGAGSSGLEPGPGGEVCVCTRVFMCVAGGARTLLWGSGGSFGAVGCQRAGRVQGSRQGARA